MVLFQLKLIKFRTEDATLKPLNQIVPCFINPLLEVILTRHDNGNSKNNKLKTPHKNIIIKTEG